MTSFLVACFSPIAALDSPVATLSRKTILRRNRKELTSARQPLDCCSIDLPF
jgi:hypothetical protein